MARARTEVKKTVLQRTIRAVEGAYDLSTQAELWDKTSMSLGLGGIALSPKLCRARALEFGLKFKTKGKKGRPVLRKD